MEEGGHLKNAVARGVDERDLKQLPGVDEDVETRLKAQGYVTLWEVAYEDATILAWTAGVARGVSEKIIAAATALLGLEEDETDASEDAAE
jgi:hypothetical protein